MKFKLFFISYSVIYAKYNYGCDGSKHMPMRYFDGKEWKIMYPRQNALRDNNVYPTTETQAPTTVKSEPTKPDMLIQVNLAEVTKESTTQNILVLLQEICNNTKCSNLKSTIERTPAEEVTIRTEPNTKHMITSELSPKPTKETTTAKKIATKMTITKRATCKMAACKGAAKKMPHKKHILIESSSFENKTPRTMMIRTDIYYPFKDKSKATTIRKIDPEIWEEIRNKLRKRPLNVIRRPTYNPDLVNFPMLKTIRVLKSTKKNYLGTNKKPTLKTTTETTTTKRATTTMNPTTIISTKATPTTIKSSATITKKPEYFSEDVRTFSELGSSFGNMTNLMEEFLKFMNAKKCQPPEKCNLKTTSITSTKPETKTVPVLVENNQSVMSDTDDLINILMNAEKYKPETMSTTSMKPETKNMPELVVENQSAMSDTDDLINILMNGKSKSTTTKRIDPQAWKMIRNKLRKRPLNVIWRPTYNPDVVNFPMLKPIRVLKTTKKKYLRTSKKPTPKTMTETTTTKRVTTTKMTTKVALTAIKPSATTTKKPEYFSEDVRSFSELGSSFGNLTNLMEEFLKFVNAKKCQPPESCKAGTTSTTSMKPETKYMPVRAAENQSAMSDTDELINILMNGVEKENKLNEVNNNISQSEVLVWSHHKVMKQQILQNNPEKNMQIVTTKQIKEDNEAVEFYNKMKYLKEELFENKGYRISGTEAQSDEIKNKHAIEIQDPTEDDRTQSYVDTVTTKYSEKQDTGIRQHLNVIKNADDQRVKNNLQKSKDVLHSNELYDILAFLTPKLKGSKDILKQTTTILDLEALESKNVNVDTTFTDKKNRNEDLTDDVNVRKEIPESYADTAIFKLAPKLKGSKDVLKQTTTISDSEAIESKNVNVEKKITDMKTKNEDLTDDMNEHKEIPEFYADTAMFNFKFALDDL